MPVLDRQLTGHLGGPTIMAVFDDLQQVAAVFITEWGQTPIIQTKRPPAESRWFATTGQAPFGRAKAAYWKINAPAIGAHSRIYPWCPAPPAGAWRHFGTG